MTETPAATIIPSLVPPAKLSSYSSHYNEYNAIGSQEIVATNLKFKLSSLRGLIMITNSKLSMFIQIKTMSELGQ